MPTENSLYQIALSLIPGIGAVSARNLVRHYGGAKEVFYATKKSLCSIPGIGYQLAENIRQSNALIEAEREIAFLEQYELGHLFFLDPDFPPDLRQIHDCPVNLFYRLSSTSLLSHTRKLAIVGTRQPTEYGRALVDELIAQLKPYNVLIVSGLAYGIDIAAHRKSVELHVPNIGVLGHGLSRIYPDQHRSTALKMIENGGLLTEYTFAKLPDREHFPMRNRIIAGMSDALLVVESGAQGGSMISAELALQYEKPVFAIPGRAGDVKSQGCNELIRSNRAQLMESAKDLAEALNWELHGKSPAVQRSLFVELSPDQTVVAQQIRAAPKIPIDELAIATRFAPGRLASLILELEFKGLVRTLPGKKYILVE